MATSAKRKAKRAVSSETSAVYRGKLTRTGNSSGFRFEGALFKSHPEFDGNVTAHVIAPGRMLVTAEPKKAAEETDPVMDAFLAFLAQDMARSPDQLIPFTAERARRIGELTQGVVVDPEEDLGEEPLL